MRSEKHGWLAKKIVSFHERDATSGYWFRRFGRPILVVYFAVLVFYNITTRITVVPIEFLVVLVIFYFAVQITLGSALIVIGIRLYKLGKTT